MEALEILLPAPQLVRLREIANQANRPVSELVQEAVDAWLANQHAAPRPSREAAPTFALGEVRATPASLRNAARGLRALRSLQEQARRAGTADLTMDEVNAEIKSARRER